MLQCYASYAKKWAELLLCCKCCMYLTSFSELRQVRGCCIKKTEGGLIMRVKRFIEWVHELKIESEKIRTESERSGTSKVNRFGASLPESMGLAKHSRVFETSGLVSEQGLKQGGFKSLKRNSVGGLKFNHKYLKSVHHRSPTGQAKKVTVTYRKAGNQPKNVTKTKGEHF